MAYNQLSARNRGLTALVIDDDAFSSKLTLNMLRKLGFGLCWEARTHTDGLRYAKLHRPDVILLDWIMPGVDGSDCLHDLQTLNVERGGTPVIVTSEKASRDAIVETARLGASAVVIKPFATTTLGARIERALKSSGKARCTDVSRPKELSIDGQSKSQAVMQLLRQSVR